MNYQNLLENKCALVLNGSDIIGQTIIKKFASHGADVAFSVTSSEIGDKILNEISESSKNSFYIVCDLSKALAVEELCSEVKKRFLLTQVVVNNPTDEMKKNILETDEFDDDLLLQINQKSIMQTTRAFLRAMADVGCGSIINISSNAVFRSIKGDPLYAMSKATSGGLTRVTAYESGRYNVRCNEILSGFQPGDEVLYNPPLKRGSQEYMDVVGIADAALFLASDMSSYITGESLTVDGGARRELFYKKQK